MSDRSARLVSDPFTTLRAQLRAIEPARDFGSVSALARDHVDVSGLGHVVAIGDRVCIGSTIEGEVLSASSETCRVVVEGGAAGLRVGLPVIAKGAPSLAPSTAWLGRVVDPDGKPMDGRPLPRGECERPLWADPPSPVERRGLGARLHTGLAVFDTLLPIARGQRLGLFAGSGVGKSRLIGVLASAMEADVIVVGLIGERGREVRDFISDTLGAEAMARTVVVAATSDRPALTRAKAAAATMTIAEFFRDQGAHVLLLADSVTRFAEAQSELAATAGEPFGANGFPASMAQMIMRLAERAGPGVSGQGDITAIFSVLVAGSDLDGPIADTMRGVLDGHVVLSREIAERGRFPAIDPLASVSRALPGAATDEELETITRARHLLGTYARAELMVQSGLYAPGADPSVDAAVAVWPDLDRFVGAPSLGSIEESFVKLAQITNRDENSASTTP